MTEQRLIKYSNRFYEPELDLSDFGINDWRIFFGVLYLMQNKNGEEFSFAVKDFMNLLNWQKSKKVFLETFDKSFSKITKLQTISGSYEEGEKKDFIQIFSGASITQDEIKIFPNQKNFFIFQNDFSLIALHKILEIKDSRHTVQLYFRLRKWADKGKFIIKYQLFKEMMGVSNFRDNDFEKKILEPSIQTLRQLDSGMETLNFSFVPSLQNKRDVIIFTFLTKEQARKIENSRKIKKALESFENFKEYCFENFKDGEKIFNSIEKNGRKKIIKDYYLLGKKLFLEVVEVNSTTKKVVSKNEIEDINNDIWQKLFLSFKQEKEKNTLENREKTPQETTKK